MWSLFFLPLFPTSPDITAPDLSSGLRGRLGKGRGERLINISPARLLGGLIHTLPIFHPPPTYSHPSLFRMCKGSPNKAVLNSESTWLVAGGILSLRWREVFSFHAARATTLLPGLKKLNMLHRQGFPGYLMTPRYKGWAQWRDWSSCHHADPACPFLSSLIISAHREHNFCNQKKKKQPCSLLNVRYVTGSVICLMCVMH